MRRSQQMQREQVIFGRVDSAQRENIVSGIPPQTQHHPVTKEDIRIYRYIYIKYKQKIVLNSI